MATAASKTVRKRPWTERAKRRLPGLIRGPMDRWLETVRARLLEVPALPKELKSELISLYVEGSYDESLERLDSALENLERASQLAMKAKDEALFWVYVIEWFTVSGTGMMCGAILWTLMVRRAAYREVGTTRFDGAG